MTARPDSPWTDERDAELRRLWSVGWRTGQIVEAMGLNRNQILGRVSRLGLEKRGRPIVPTTPAADDDQPLYPISARSHRSPPRTPDVDAVERRREASRRETARLRPRDDEPLRIDALFATEAPPHQQPIGCRFIAGSGTTWRYCQQVPVDGQSYCPAHADRCYRRDGAAPED